MHLQMRKLYPFEIGDHPDGGIKTTCQSGGQNFAGAWEIAFTADGLVNRYRYVHRETFAADDVRVDWMICRNLNI